MGDEPNNFCVAAVGGIVELLDEQGFFCLEIWCTSRELEGNVLVRG